METMHAYTSFFKCFKSAMWKENQREQRVGEELRSRQSGPGWQRTTCPSGADTTRSSERLIRHPPTPEESTGEKKVPGENVEEKAGLLLLWWLLFLQFPRVSLACLGCRPPLFLPAHTLAKSQSCQSPWSSWTQNLFCKKNVKHLEVSSNQLVSIIPE